MPMSWISRLKEYVATSPLRALLAGGAALLALALAALGVWHGRSAPVRDASYTELLGLASGEVAREVRVEGERVTVELLDGAAASAVVANPDTQHALVSRFSDARVPVRFEARDGGALRAVGPVLPVLVLLGVGGAAYALMRKRGQNHFQVSDSASPAARGEVGFDQVAGVEEAKDALAETVEFLRSPERFSRLGGRPPRGVLLTGPPGTGKTLLARAVAGEAKVPFLSTSGSSFQEMFVGVGASRVRSLFQEARRVAPCIVFIDEIDALGRSRSRASDSAAADHDQMLNQLLVEMDGFEQQEGIVVMASTNRPDVLDAALLRPGRFDRQVVIGLPDLRGRLDILAVHARKIALAPEVDLGHVARGTPGFSGADLANLLNEAAILAARTGAPAVAQEHLELARDKVLLGAERRGFRLDEVERHATAVHEAGHVVVGMSVAHGDPIHKVTILPRGRALGVTQALPERDRVMYSRGYLEDQIALLLGGRAAEQEVLRTMTAGASDDIERAVRLARRMVAELGMSELGPIHLGEPEAARSQALLDRVEAATDRLVQAQMERARAIVRERRGAVLRLVEALLERDTLDAEEIRRCCAEGPVAAA